jgi:hypothetical protein
VFFFCRRIRTLRGSASSLSETNHFFMLPMFVQGWVRAKIVRTKFDFLTNLCYNKL